METMSVFSFDVEEGAWRMPEWGALLWVGLGQGLTQGQGPGSWPPSLPDGLNRRLVRWQGRMDCFPPPLDSAEALAGGRRCHVCVRACVRVCVRASAVWSSTPCLATFPCACGPTRPPPPFGVLVVHHVPHSHLACAWGARPPTTLWVAHVRSLMVAGGVRYAGGVRSFVVDAGGLCTCVVLSLVQPAPVLSRVPYLSSTILAVQTALHGSTKQKCSGALSSCANNGPR